MLRKRGSKGQSAAEYALLLAVVLASFVGMQTYFKRGIQATLKGNIDEFGPEHIAVVPGGSNENKGDILVADELVSSASKEEKNVETGGSFRRDLPEKEKIEEEVGPGQVDEYNTRWTQGYTEYFQGYVQTRIPQYLYRGGGGVPPPRPPGGGRRRREGCALQRRIGPWRKACWNMRF